jgi:hypothetical protein
MCFTPNFLYQRKLLGTSFHSAVVTAHPSRNTDVVDPLAQRGLQSSVMKPCQRFDGMSAFYEQVGYANRLPHFM